MNVRAFSVGRISLPPSHVRARRRTLPGRYLDIVRDNRRTEPMPIWCWLIDHPDGRILVDVGDVTSVFDPGGLSAITRRVVDLDGYQLQPEDELDRQLEASGIDPADIETVVLSHLHFDHAGAVERFPNASVLVTRREYAVHRLFDAGSPLRRWPANVDKRLVSHSDGPYGPFGGSHRVTDDGAVVLVPTPGHTPGHQSVIVREGGRLLFLAGDTTFTESQLFENEVGGIALNARSSRRTMARIRELCDRESVVYLPSHDPTSQKRLHDRTETREPRHT